MLLDKISTKIIAEKYNVHPNTIGRIKSGNHPMTKYIGKYSEWL
jgi:uncharacterized protein YjcR